MPPAWSRGLTSTLSGLACLGRVGSLTLRWSWADLRSVAVTRASCVGRRRSHATLPGMRWVLHGNPIRRSLRLSVVCLKLLRAWLLRPLLLLLLWWWCLLGRCRAGGQFVFRLLGHLLIGKLRRLA